jgi:3'-phosphoadenosine 5'-phosphosulfate sulfotransferase (PAPS reductase)/FAD synthetase
LRQKLEFRLHWLKQDFTGWWWRRRDYVRDKWPEKGVPSDVVARALAVFEKGPTGNPYLDLCIIKGRFPSRKVQFCTQFLKTEPLMEFANDLLEAGNEVESWQGVRAEESPSRAALPEREDRGGGYSVYRPIHKWTVGQVFDQHRKHGVDPNPLYKQGMGRVGCMPCINVAKDELLEISKRFPEHIDRIAEWERFVSLASKRGKTTFIPSPGDNDTAWDRGNIRRMVEWSQTQRGGRKYDWVKILEEPKACASSYGLCE